MYLPSVISEGFSGILSSLLYTKVLFLSTDLLWVMGCVGLCEREGGKRGSLVTGAVLSQLLR
jgi:hypothetical protein